MLTECYFRAADGINCCKQNTKWGEMSFSNELIVIWEDGLMENQIPMYRTQACSWANVGLVSLRKNYLGSTLCQHSNEHCCTSVQHGTNMWSNLDRWAKSHWANIGEQRTLDRYNERWTTNVGPTLYCYLRLPLWHARARCNTQGKKSCHSIFDQTKDLLCIIIQI